jgi:hypothetical protein
MDEILIEEKKYVSSKRAAQITGYAKDYIGQLCREGRVPARLVGRSWYVLESAIQDHRFGKPVEDSAEKAPARIVQSEAFPRYQAIEPQILPSVNRLTEGAHADREEEKELPEAVFEASEAPEADGPWKAWFDIASVPASDTGKTLEEPEEKPSDASEEEHASEETEEIEIPIRAIHHPDLTRMPEPPKEEARHEDPIIGIEEDTQAVPAPGSERTFAYRRPLQATAVFFAMVAVAIATLGSGYLDRFAGDFSVASVIAGVTSVKK